MGVSDEWLTTPYERVDGAWTSKTRARLPIRIGDLVHWRTVRHRGYGTVADIRHVTVWLICRVDGLTGLRACDGFEGYRYYGFCEYCHVKDIVRVVYPSPLISAGAL